MKNANTYGRPLAVLVLALGAFMGSRALANVGTGHTVDPNGCEHATNSIPNLCHTPGWNIAKTSNGFSVNGTQGTVYTQLVCSNPASGAVAITGATGYGAGTSTPVCTAGWSPLGSVCGLSSTCSMNPL